MTNKLLLCIGTMALSTLAMAGPKTYDVVLASAMKAGSVELAPGEYKLRVDGSNAIFTGAQSHESVTVPVKIENGNTKFNATALDSSNQGGKQRITAIELGGSTIKLEFGQ